MLTGIVRDRTVGAKVSGIVILLLTYSRGIFQESFWSDDYAIMGIRSMARHVLGDARPASAGLFSLSFSLIHSPGNAWVLRLLAFVAVVWIFLRLANSIQDTSHRAIGIFALAVGLCIPSFQLYIHWTIVWCFSWAALAGLYSFYFWFSRRIFKKLIAVALLALALTIYPPAALFFFASIAVINVLNQSKITIFISQAVRALILFAISLPVSAFAALIAIRIAGISASGRVQLVQVADIPRKVIWILTRPLVVGLRPFTIDSPTPKIALFTVLPMIAVLTLGLRRQSMEMEERFLWRALIVVAPLLLSLLPIVVSSDNQIEFRVLPGYCWGLAVLGVYFLLIEIEALFAKVGINVKQRQTLGLLISGVLSLVVIVSVNLRYEQFFAEPYREKSAFLNEKISNCLKDKNVKDILILPPKYAFPTFQNLGVFSMTTDLASPWVPQPNVALLLRQRNITLPVSYNEKRPASLKIAQGECLIDLEEFRELLLKNSS